MQGCQIFLDTKYQNGEKYAKLSPNGHNLYQIAVIYSKWALNIPTFSILRASQIYTNWISWFENIQSGNPDGLLSKGHRYQRICSGAESFF
jgi:hypothetical protein